MLNLKKEAESLKQEEFRLGECPACGSLISHQYFMRHAETKKESKWFSCVCGVVFQDKKPTFDYDQKYWDKYNDQCKKIRASYEYPVRIYAPIIEDRMYGRRVLLVGKQTSHQEDAFKERGWVPTSIDRNPASNPHILSDFEKYQFPETIKYNLIWIYHALECLHDPIASLDLCSKLLAEDGIIVIVSPDSDFIHTRSSSNFMHWNDAENYMMWNRRSISKKMESLKFDTILLAQNQEPRFPQRDDFHGIWQKKFF